MVAYSFNPRFEAAIRAGTKTQTIRAARKRHARSGEMVQLYCGMRTVHCRKIIPDVVCLRTEPVTIQFDPDGTIADILIGGQSRADLDAFAVRDGFRDITDMAAFWRAAHGVVGTFNGVMIQWDVQRGNIDQGVG